MRRPTMKDVAERAGFTTSTVSRALGERTRGMLSEDTVARVLAAAEELDYRPNALAQGLRTQRSNTVGMLLPDISNPFFPRIVRGLEDALGAREYTLTVVNTDNDTEREHAALHTLLERQVDGLVLATAHLGVDADLAAGLRQRPTVLVNRQLPGSGLPFVVPDDVAGVRAVVAHLRELGHQRLAHVAGPQGLSTGRTRLTAFRDACDRAGLAEPAVAVADAFTRSAGEIACRRLLDDDLPFTALFAANDLLAIGALQVLRAGGLDVPGDVSLVGYNDMPLSDLIDPALTTVHVPQYEMGEMAAKLLLDQFHDVDPRAAEVVLETRLVVRDSARPVG